MKSKWNIVGIICALALVAVLGSILLQDRREAREEAARIQSVAEAAKPYEDKITQIRREMQKRQKLVSGDGLPAVMLCVLADSGMEISRAKEQLGDFWNYAAVVLSVSDLSASREDLIGLARGEGCFVMLKGNPQEDLTQAEAWRTRIEETGQQTVFWFMDEEDYQGFDENALAAANYPGFTQMTDYGLSLVSGTLENGLVYFEHVPIIDGENRIDSTLRLCTSEGKAAALTLDMSGLGKEVSEKTAEEILELLAGYEEDGDVVLCTLEEFYTLDTQMKQDKAQREQEYQEYAAEQEERIAQLEAQIDELYGR